MRYLTAAVAASAALVSAAPTSLVARDDSTMYALQFTGDSSYEGFYLSSCHIGAGENAFCGMDPNPNFIYQLNSTNFEGGDLPGRQAILYYNQPANDGTAVIPETLALFTDIASNLGIAVLGGGQSILPIGIKEDNSVGLFSHVNYSKNPPKSHNATILHRWYMCNINYEGYTYNALNWLYGKDDPITPGCTKVGIRLVAES